MLSLKGILLSITSALLIVMASHTDASSTELYLGYASGCYHWSQKDYYNEDNNHAIMFSVNRFWGITFRNSYYDRTVGFGYVFRTPKVDLKDFGLGDTWVRGNLPVGVIHGYDNRKIEVAGWSPAALPAIEFGLDNFSVNITVFPIVVFMVGIYF